MSSSFKLFCNASLEGCELYVNPAREKLGYTSCMKCGDKLAKQKTKLYTVVPMHKSNYVAVFNREDLAGINNKGGSNRGNT
jgi:hypothetical protein